MRVLVVGAGPAGLYFAYLLKRERPDWHIRIVERNAVDSTFGFGVVFSDRALEFIRADDPETFELVTPSMERWSNLAIVHAGERTVVDGIGFAAIGRLDLLHLLQRQVRQVGLAPEYERDFASAAEFDDYDLVVGADGMNSFVRQSFAEEFGTTVTHLGNKFIWYGTTKRFETLTQTFVQTPTGFVNAHHYRYSNAMSTYLVEADPETWTRTRFSEMDDASTRAYFEELLGDSLEGHRLVANKSVWRTFPKIKNERWSTRARKGFAVLIGDALHTAHYSIGSGTRLAMEDAIALGKAIREHPKDLAAALGAYEAARRPIADKLVAAADASAEWYEHFPEHMRLAPWDFAWSYVQRSGRMSADKLRRVAPLFVADYEASR